MEPGQRILDVGVPLGRVDTVCSGGFWSLRSTTGSRSLSNIQWLLIVFQTFKPQTLMRLPSLRSAPRARWTSGTRTPTFRVNPLRTDYPEPIWATPKLYSATHRVFLDLLPPPHHVIIVAS